LLTRWWSVDSQLTRWTVELDSWLAAVSWARW